MNEELSLWELVLNASFVVQLVMLLLFMASVVSWGMIVQRALLLRRAKQQLLGFEQTFWSGIDLSQLYRDGSSRLENGERLEGVENLFRAGFKEFTRLRQQEGIDSDAIMEGAQRAMRVALSREEEHLERHLPFLATVGSTSPYVGLFGTVWGIMHSFRGLANVHQATLATVAPGISEALIATAMGLFAAIPAVIAYNRYSARVENLIANYETFAEEFSSILHRQAHAVRKSA
ncbi:MAG: protein TolQ [Gammaproteobacteria bacterium]|nr:protein TolQ [Gammaproteobacteria bacterium]MBP6051659.1 protein TolQ [Pseudomonadales bacterium]MBK6584669.1 protein TolQ [Gammaproteobacteria bacterium]MBK7171003.1 protein TolQ [Gammaproteobacteria bacterium]MBK7519822.1 protein TolQ [Gammaproteobacteria bacterium]